MPTPHSGVDVVVVKTHRPVVIVIIIIITLVVVVVVKRVSSLIQTEPASFLSRVPTRRARRND
jgi:hypothetical protein